MAKNAKFLEKYDQRVRACSQNFFFVKQENFTETEKPIMNFNLKSWKWYSLTSPLKWLQQKLPCFSCALTQSSFLLLYFNDFLDLQYEI